MCIRDRSLESSVFEPVDSRPTGDGQLTIGRLSLTPAQKLIIVALCEDCLLYTSRCV